MNDQPSRTTQKRESEALRKLGAELVKLKEEDLSRIPIPGELAEAVALARRLPKGGGLRRQMQHIGAIMRHVDAEPIRLALAEVRAEHRTAAGELHAIEHWRDRLVQEGEIALSELISEKPGADAARLRRLMGEARHERDADKPPRAARTLYRYLRDHVCR